LVFTIVFLVSLYERSDIFFISYKAAFFIFIMLSMPYVQYVLTNHFYQIYQQNQQSLANSENISISFTSNVRAYWPVVAIDAIACGIAIGYLHFEMTPTLVFLAILVLRLIELNNALFSTLSVLACLATAFVTMFALGIDIHSFNVNKDYMVDGSVGLRVTAITSFIIYVFFVLSHMEKQNTLLKDKILEAEKANKQYVKIANKIARYAPSQVWQSIANGTFESRIFNKRKKLTIFFSDIAGFTELSDTLSSDDLAALLNTYFEKMSNIAKKYGGTIDKFIGDALVIFFGDPTSNGTRNDAVACVEMAIAMQNEMKHLRLKSKNSELGELHVRIGISTGYCHVGNFGNASRMSYTVIGREANLAARLQSAAGIDDILINQETYEHVRSYFSCSDRGMLDLRGLAQPVQAWRVVERYESVPSHQRRWSEYEMDGFNLQLDMDMIKPYEKEHIRKALQDVIDNLDRSKT